MKILFTLIVLLFSTQAFAGTPYTSVQIGMLFLYKEDAKSLYTTTIDRDDVAKLELMGTCMANNTCTIIDPGTEVFLEEQAEYPLILLRVKGQTRKFWTLTNVIGLN